MISEAESDEINFGYQATEYYAAARLAKRAGGFTAPGSLFHHVVEYYLKMGLRSTHDRVALKKRGLRHDLRGLWAAFKAKFPAASLSPHDATIAALDRYEAIRYPDEITDRGMRSTGAPTMATTGTTVPEYHVAIDDMDSLVKAVFEAAGFNPKGYFDQVPPKMREAIYHENKSFAP